MHGCYSGSALLVNAEVDSMGGVVDGGVGMGVNTSPRQAAIEKAQAVLRQEYDVREERRRELEFLEKGGNPLDLKFGNAASVSIQSTSLTDHPAEHFMISEAKGSFALTASPHGDSLESCGRPGVATVCEPNSADNLLLFNGENEPLEVKRKPKHPYGRNNVAPSEHSSRTGGTQNAKEAEDCAIFRPYARRNRSRTNRDGVRSSSTDMVQIAVVQRPSLPARGLPRDVKGVSDLNNQKNLIVKGVFESDNQKNLNATSVSNPKLVTSNGDMVSRSSKQSSSKLDDMQSAEVMTNHGKGSSTDGRLNVTASVSVRDNQKNQPSVVGAQQIPAPMALEEPDIVGGKPEIGADPVCPPCPPMAKAENETGSVQPNEFGDLKGDRRSMGNEAQNSHLAVGTKVLDSESSGTQNTQSIDINNDNDVCISRKIVNTNGISKDERVEHEGTQNLANVEMVHGKNELDAIGSSAVVNDDHGFFYQDNTRNGSLVKVEQEMHASKFDMENEAKPTNMEGVQQKDDIVLDTDVKKVGNLVGDESNLNTENLSSRIPQGSVGCSVHELPETTLAGRNLAAAHDLQTCFSNHSKLADKVHEDSILEEARTIEAKRKRIAELSIGTSTSEIPRKSHWDFILEEMAWLANDFAQERLWKMTTAAQVCRRVAFTSRTRSEEHHQCWKVKKVAHTIVKAVLQFWHSAEALLTSYGPNNCKIDEAVSRKVDGDETSTYKSRELDKEARKGSEVQQSGENLASPVQAYAVRFLKYICSPVPSIQAEAPATPDRVSDLGTTDMSWNDHLTEESLFYAVPSGAMEAYRKSIDSQVMQCEKTGRSVQEEVDTSMYDAVAEFGYHESAYEEDEGETSAYYLPGPLESSKSSIYAQKKRKNTVKSYNARSYVAGADLPYGHSMVGYQQSMLLGNGPANSLNVGSIPTKRTRTASRQRVISPFGVGATGVLQVTKTDASSGDTSSYQDDQSTLHGGSHIHRNMEVESVGDFEKQVPYDYAETSKKHKKKKKTKNPGSGYEHGWQLDSSLYNEQRDHSKRRMESHLMDSNGTGGLYGQHNAKKPKLIKQQLDSTFDNIIPISGSTPSPVASQMSNMPNPNKFIKFIGGRDRGRKSKTPKMSAVQPASGSPWPLFEDQALVVLVHDMGPNWELVSDAINSTLQFKCIFRKPKECKERHNILMNRSTGDGADSAEDSGTSQSYPSTLPGIPKGSARQLFQRLQGPMEEDTIKSHFEKIIMIGKKQHYRKSQNDNLEAKQIAAVHNSHVLALSHVVPNNLNGVVLTPLQLSDASSPDVLSLGYQSSHVSGLPISNQGSVASALPTSGANSALQGSSGVVVGSHSSSPSGQQNASTRDSRYGVPRTSLTVDEQQRMQYSHMLAGRSMQQPNLSPSGVLPGADRGVRMMPGANGMGMMCGMNRSMPMSTTGFQGMPSAAMLNSGSMLSSSGVGMPSSVNMHSGAGSGQGNSLMTPREALHMTRPGHNPEHQRPMMAPDIQMQVSQGSSQGNTALNGLSSTFSNHTSPAAVQTHPGHHHQHQHQLSPQQSHVISNPHHPQVQGSNHAMGPHQQAHAFRLAKERQMQQRFLQQQQQNRHLAASSALMPRVQPQPQAPISSPLQNSSQIKSQTQTQPVSLPPLTPSSPMTPMTLPHQQKPNMPSHGLNRNPQTGASGLNVGKQRQRQPQQQQFQQSGRHHPQQRQNVQSQQLAKHLKGMGSGNMLPHQNNLAVDSSHLNGLSDAPGSQGVEKGEQMMHLMQGQGLYSGSSLSPVQQSKSLVTQSSNHSQSQEKFFSGPTPSSSKPVQHMPSHSDCSSQSQVPAVGSGQPLANTRQVVPAPVVASNHQQLQGQPQLRQKQFNQSQPPAQRMLQQRVILDPSNKSQVDQAPADHQPVNSASQMDGNTTVAMSQACVDSTNVVPVVPSAVPPQWKPPQTLYDSGMPNPATQMDSVGSMPLSNSDGNDPIPSVSQGLVQRQLSGGLPPHGHNSGAQLKQQLHMQQSSTPLPPSQQQCQPQEQLENSQQEQQQSPPSHLPLQQSQQQMQPLQAAKGSLYDRPTNSKLE